jgi:hypothetical protein
MIQTARLVFAVVAKEHIELESHWGMSRAIAPKLWHLDEKKEAHNSVPAIGSLAAEVFKNPMGMGYTPRVFPQTPLGSA